MVWSRCAPSGDRWCLSRELFDKHPNFPRITTAPAPDRPKPRHVHAMLKLGLLTLCASGAALRVDGPLRVPTAALSKVAPALTAFAVTAHSEAAHAKSVLGVNGGLDFGPLAGDQPGGEGTGKALGTSHPQSHVADLCH